MFLDRENSFQPHTTPQVPTATAVSTDTIDLGANPRDIGVDSDMELVVQVVNAFAGGTSLQPILQTATDVAMTSPISLMTGPVIPLASLTAGATFSLGKIPPGALRALRMNYVIVGTMSGGGSIRSFLVRDRQANRAYADRMNVDGL